MHREKEYKQVAENARKRAGDEENAQLSAQWEILATTYVHLADQSKKIDDSLVGTQLIIPTQLLLGGTV
jgi:hypothetical protein